MSSASAVDSVPVVRRRFPEKNKMPKYAFADTTNRHANALTLQSTSDTTEPMLELFLVGRSRAPDTRIHIKVSHLDRREAEMQQAAKQFQIPPDRWAGSLLYRQYYEHGRKSLHLDPERDCVERNYSYAMQWEDWLTKLLVQYYETGRLNIPDACQGSDLLLLLEYFGILYAPDQLVFASYAAYQRVRAWSDYLTQRSVLADHVVNMITLVPTRSARTFQLGTVESPNEKLCLQNNRNTEMSTVYSWGCDVTDLLSQSHLAPQSLPTSRVIYNLFNMTKENKVADALRDDFGVYLQNMLPPQSDVTFSVKMVLVRAGAIPEPYRGKRAILKITVEPNRTKSEMTFPADEVTATRLSPDPVPLVSGKPPLPPSNSNAHKTAEHVYRDLDEDDPPKLDKRSPSKLSQQRSLDPVMAGNSQWKAPVNIIDAMETGTVTSALTGPFNGGDSAMGDEDARAEALRHEWVQGSLLNRDIDDRMKELLEGDKEWDRPRKPPSPIAEEESNPAEVKPVEPGTPETTASFESESPSPQQPEVDKGCAPWEWLNLMCTDFLDPQPRSPNRRTKPIQVKTEQTPIIKSLEAKPKESQDKLDHIVTQPRQSPQHVANVVVSAVAEPPLEPTADVVVSAVTPQTSAVKEPKVTTHEGVKQRLAELRRQKELEQKKMQSDCVKPVKESRQEKAAETTGGSKSSKQSDASHVNSSATTPSRKGNAFFRGASKKQANTVVTRKTPKKNTNAPSAPKRVAAPKTAGLMKLFRRGNE